MRPTLNRCIVFVAITLFSTVALFGLSVELNAIQYPEKYNVKVEFSSTQRAPGGQLHAKVEYEEGQAKIELSFERLKPPVLFGGDVTAYVLWAVTRDGSVENLGELYSGEGKGKSEYSTGQKDFAMLVTAEPHFLVTSPSELLLFTSQKTKSKRAGNKSFVYEGFAAAPTHDLASIAEFDYSGDTPFALMQAENTYGFAKRTGALDYAPQIMREAKVTLAQARNLSIQKRNRKGMVDYARRSVALSSEAIRVTERKIEAEKLAEEIKLRRAEMQGLIDLVAKARQDKLAAEEQKAGLYRDMEELSREIFRVNEEKAAVAGQMEEALKTLDGAKREQATVLAEMEALKDEMAAIEVEKQSLEVSKRELESSMEGLQAEKEQLSSRLEGALGQVADTQKSARGLIVNLPDILFDFNKATLKEVAKITLAKLTGILIIMPELNLRVEGHTDSIGTPEYNQKLSQKRSETVLSFLREQGVASERMVSAGYGMERPVADNSTKEGQAKNRRVEIIISEGVVQEIAP